MFYGAIVVRDASQDFNFVSVLNLYVVHTSVLLAELKLHNAKATGSIRFESMVREGGDIRKYGGAQKRGGAGNVAYPETCRCLANAG